MLVAATVVIARNPTVLTHAQMWAEDGRVYFQDVYDLGVRRTLLLPQSGYFQTFPVVLAWLARQVPLSSAPLVMAIGALAVQILPVGLLLSRRGESISTQLWVRTLIAAVYLMIPYNPELDARAVNAQWYLAITALLIVVIRPPRGRPGRVLDGMVLIGSAITGPFVLFLAPMAWALRRIRKGRQVPGYVLAITSFGFVIQAICLLVIAPHDATNPAVEPRPSPALGASPRLFATLVGGRSILGAVIGEANGAAAPALLQWLAIVAFGATLIAIVRARRLDLLALIVFASAVLFGGLMNPSAPSPAWPALGAMPPQAQRYFFMFELAVVLSLVWLSAHSSGNLARSLFGCLALVALVGSISSHWQFARLPSTGFYTAAKRFETAAPGTQLTIPIEPSGWSMTLLKR